MLIIPFLIWVHNPCLDWFLIIGFNVHFELPIDLWLSYKLKMPFKFMWCMLCVCHFFHHDHVISLWYLSILIHFHLNGYVPLNMFTLMHYSDLPWFHTKFTCLVCLPWTMWLQAWSKLHLLSSLLIFSLYFFMTPCHLIVLDMILGLQLVWAPFHCLVLFGIIPHYGSHVPLPMKV